ncbi:Protein dispatched-like 1 [Holothuria leucospilota]|uniref:Protein dispatched-like 1 n=1 Tax=Holothuria leucospilota TaxID=206669 RepID=A0A9Q1CFT7_HOLLE|nr:Protein dispatched-like 1 [Holothuria leucospilota]
MTYLAVFFIMQATTRQEKERNFVYGYAATIERFPVVISLLILLITFGFGGVAFLLHGLPSFDEPRLGFETRGSPISARGLSFQKFRFAERETLSPVPYNVPLSSLDAAESKGPEDEETDCPQPSAGLPRIVYKSSTGDDMFEIIHLKSVCSNEEKNMRTHSIFMSECRKVNGTDCCPSWSLGYAVALLNNKSACSEINQDDVMKTKALLATCSKFYNSGELKADCNPTTCTDIPSQCIYQGIVHTVFHYLLPKSFVNKVELNPESLLQHTVTFSPICGNCREIMEPIFKDNFQNSDNLDDGVVEVDALQFYLEIPLFDELVTSDLWYVGVGVMAVTAIIWLYTRSLVITVGAIFNMLMSMVLTFSLYYLVFRIKFFPFINIISSVLVIGVGGDDTFVYVDLWRAARDEIGRGSDKRALVLEKATRHAFLTLLVTSLTTSSALYVTVISNIVASKCFAIFAGTVLFSNFVYTITWLPCIIVIHDKYFAMNSGSHTTNKCRSCLILWIKYFEKGYNIFFKLPKILFQKILPKLIFSLRFLWIVILFLLGIAGIVFTFAYPRLALQESGSFRIFQDNHPFERYSQIHRDDLAFELDSRESLQIAYIWGVLTTTNANSWDPLDFGTLEFDPNFTFGTDESQKWLSSFCTEIKEQNFYKKESNSLMNFCFMDDFTSWMNRTCLSQEDKPCCEQAQNITFQQNVFNECVIDFTVFRCKRYPCLSYTPGLRFDKNNSIKGLYLNFESSVPYLLQFGPVDDFWQALSAWTNKQLSGAPLGLQNGWSYAHLELQLGFYDLQSAVVIGTVLTIAISLATALVVLLLSTQNILITLYAIVTITFTVFSVIGTLVWIGWELNIFESVIFSLAIGLSVDFTIHYGVAYRIAPSTDRKSRTFFAIETLGSSIAVAALSTFTAGAIMIPTTVINYSQLGVFLTVTMSLSWLFSTFFFLPLCLTIGPNGDAGQLLKLLSKFRKKPPSNGGIVNPNFVADNDHR